MMLRLVGLVVGNLHICLEVKGSTRGGGWLAQLSIEIFLEVVCFSILIDVECNPNKDSLSPLIHKLSKVMFVSLFECEC